MPLVSASPQFTAIPWQQDFLAKSESNGKICTSPDHVRFEGDAADRYEHISELDTISSGGVALNHEASACVCPHVCCMLHPELKAVFGVLAFRAKGFYGVNLAQWRSDWLVNQFSVADVAELADALDSKSSIREDVWVRPPPSAPLK